METSFWWTKNAGSSGWCREIKPEKVKHRLLWCSLRVYARYGHSNPWFKIFKPEVYSNGILLVLVWSPCWRITVKMHELDIQEDGDGGSPIFRQPYAYGVLRLQGGVLVSSIKWLLSSRCHPWVYWRPQYRIQMGAGATDNVSYNVIHFCRTLFGCCI